MVVRNIPAMVGEKWIDSDTSERLESLVESVREKDVIVETIQYDDIQRVL